MIDKVRKKWIVTWYLNVDGCYPDQVSSFVEQAKKHLGQETLENFFETETLVFFVPVREKHTSMEVHEIILDTVGYDKYETIIKNKNLNVQDVLDQLKELLDVEK